MINVTIFRNENQITAFELAGHAESGPYGYDLVCAGVSAVSFGTINSISVLCGVDLQIDQADQGGYLHVTLPDMINEPDVEKQVQLLLDSMLVGLQTIERDYSQFIIIKNQ